MKKILVPCDFSTYAVDAFRVAVNLAQKMKSKVEVLFVIELPVVMDPVLMPVVDYELSMKNDMQEYVTTKFESLLKRFGDAKIETTLAIQYGGITRTIVQAASEKGVALVVMGSQGASGMRELLVGSNAERVVRFSAVPVLVVKEFTAKPIKTIVLPYDLSVHQSKAFISKIKQLQQLHDAQIHAVWINTPTNFTSDIVTRKRLDEFVKANAFANCTAQAFNAASEVEGILQFSEIVQADLIAMATHGRKGIAHLLQGSVTEDVLNHASKLIWTFVDPMLSETDRELNAKEAKYTTGVVFI
jgi:nucleotide-binding universal stress UspA family protein